MNEQVTYQQAGVNIDEGDKIINTVKPWIQETHTSSVLGGLGHFAGLYDLTTLNKQYHQPILVQSIDGIGTKTMVANMADCFEHLGADLLSACSNDLLVLGAKTLTLLDYIASDKLCAQRLTVFIKGLTQACKENNVALIGGETAEMPGTYQRGEHDFAGIATGVVDKTSIIDGKTIQPNDLILGLASSGLHTNGYSLARKLLFEIAGFKIHQYIDELQTNAAEALLVPHKNYNLPVHALLKQSVPIHGMAHITGGGLLGNIPRILPANTSALINKKKLDPACFISIITKHWSFNHRRML